MGGLLLKCAVKKPYIEAVTASLYAYAENLLLVSAQLFHSALYITLFTMLSVVFFLSNKSFNGIKTSDTKKIAIAAVMLIVFLHR